MKRAGCISSVVVVSAFAAVAALFRFDDPQAEVRKVEKCFAGLPGIRLIWISDLTKQASKSIEASVDVPGKGGMSFTGMCPQSFESAPHLYLTGVGPYVFRTRELVKGTERYGWAIDVGPASPVSAFRKLDIRNVQTAASRYDDLIAAIAGWPVTAGEWPASWPAKEGEWSATSDKEIHFPDPPGGDYFFCLKRSEIEPQSGT